MSRDQNQYPSCRGVTGSRSQLRAKPGDPSTLASTGGAARRGDFLSWEVWGAAAGGSWGLQGAFLNQVGRGRF